jgi:hypothetical protein
MQIDVIDLCRLRGPQELFYENVPVVRRLDEWTGAIDDDKR